jgi:hypothetical protein
MTRNIHLAGNYWEKCCLPSPNVHTATALPLKEDIT